MDALGMDGAAQAGGGPAAEASGPAGTDAGAPEEDGAAGQQGASGHRGGRGRRRRAPRERGGGRPQRPLWKELPVLVVVALVLALIVKTFLLQAFSIPSESMQNTLQPGDRVLVDKLTPWFGSKPERGDVVVFHDPADWLGDEEAPHPNVIQKALGFIGLMPAAGERDLIKRVIGVAGDTVECQGTGPVKVNGRPLDEPYLMPGNTPCTEDGQGGQFKVTVPKGTIWVMGDHRQNSLDSRYHQQDTTHGFVPVGNVVGRAVVVAWPLDRWSTLPVPHTFSQPGISAAAATAPTAVGVAGAVPLVLWRRRRKL